VNGEGKVLVGNKTLGGAYTLADRHLEVLVLERVSMVVEYNFELSVSDKNPGRVAVGRTLDAVDKALQPPVNKENYGRLSVDNVLDIAIPRCPWMVVHNAHRMEWRSPEIQREVQVPLDCPYPGAKEVLHSERWDPA